MTATGLALLVLVAAMALLVCSVRAAVALLAPERRAATGARPSHARLISSGASVAPV